MIKNEYETTFYSEKDIILPKSLSKLINHFNNEDEDIFFKFYNYIYFLFDNNNDTDKKKVSFKLDDSHIVYKESKKKLSSSSLEGVQFYVEEKEKWKPLSEFDISMLKPDSFFIYYKEKYIYKVKKEGTKYTFIGDDVFYVDVKDLEVRKNTKYIEIEADDIKRLKSYQEYFESFLNKDNEFNFIDNKYSKFNICREILTLNKSEFYSVHELENILNQIFINAYLYCARYDKTGVNQYD